MTEKRKSGFSIAVPALLLCLAFSVCACGKKSADTETVEEQDLIGATTINTLRIAEDGKITESTGGGQAFETKGEDLAPYLEGIWEESDGGTHYLEIALVDDGGLSFRVSDSSGRNGNTVFYTMTAYYDAILEELVYWDGTEHSAVITGEETETEESNTGEGTGMFGIVVLSDEETDDAAIGIHWLDNTFGNDGTNMFVKSE